MITKKSKGGKGKAETLRNDAIKTLNKVSKKRWNTYTLGKLFERDPKTVSGILET